MTKIDLDVLKAKAAVDEPLPEVERVDFSQLPPERYPVWGKGLERGALTLLTGRRGTGKTFLYTGLAGAMATGSPTYLDDLLVGQRILIVDEENPRYVAQARFRALGVLSDENVWYYNRNGVRLGERRWNRWLEEQVQEFRPDVIVVDGLVAATNVSDVNDQTQARGLYDFLKAMAEAYDCAVLVLHHEKKRQKDVSFDPSEATLGAITFINLADIHLRTDLPTDEEQLRMVKWDQDDGVMRTIHTEPELQWLRLRDDIEPPPGTFVIESVKQEDKLMELVIHKGADVAPSRVERKQDVKRERLTALFSDNGFVVGEEYRAADFISHLEGGRDEWTKLKDSAVTEGWLTLVRGGPHATYRFEGAPTPPAV